MDAVTAGLSGREEEDEAASREAEAAAEMARWLRRLLFELLLMLAQVRTAKDVLCS